MSGLGGQSLVFAPVPGRRLPKLALEGAIEGCFRFVPDIGGNLGHYEVLSLLDQGGMGDVYKAGIHASTAAAETPQELLEHEREARTVTQASGRRIVRSG